MKRSILVTGGSSGIGKATVQQLAAAGHRVFATYRGAEDREALAAIANVVPLRMDVTSAAEIAAAVEEVSMQTGADGLYAVVNNAGIAYAAPFEFADEKRGWEVMDVNLMAPFRVTKAFLPLLLKHNERNAVKARVINVASWAASLGQPFIPFYNASKFGLAGLSESMYYDLGLLGVHVVLASPGTTRTPLLGKTTRGGLESLDRMPAEGRERYRPLLEHFATLGESYASSPIFRTPEQVAARLAAIVGQRRPAYKQELSLDACFVDRFLSRFVPWGMKVAMNRRMFRLTMPVLPT
jgi:NAD(P)-dependent dehydrogenase (short-subunit alcohol dehydrogenase family)